MSTITKTVKFHFINLFNLQIIICIAVLLLHLLISVAVINLVSGSDRAGVNDFIVMCWIFIMCLVIFAPSFKYMLSQGISRKRFFLAMSSNIILLAVILALLSTIFYIITLKVANVWMIYELIYRDQSILGILVWEFAALLFLGALAWLIRLAYYVSDLRAKLLVSIIPFVLVSLLILFNALADGAIGRAIWVFIKTVMGLSHTDPNPYIGMASMLAAAVIIGGPTFLLLRRAQVKD